MKLLNTYLGTPNGQIGKTFVFFVWKGIKCARSWVIPSNPQSFGQTAQREKFTIIMEVGRGLLSSVIQKFWKKFAIQMSEFNAFMSSNLNAMTSKTDWQHFLISKGHLQPTVISDATYDAATGEVIINWDGTVINNQLASDKFVGVIVDTQYRSCWIIDSGTLRSAQTQLMDTMPGLTFSYLRCYSFFYRDLGLSTELIGDSAYSLVGE